MCDDCGAEATWDSETMIATVTCPEPMNRVVFVNLAVQVTRGTADKKIAYRILQVCLDKFPGKEVYFVLMGRHWTGKGGATTIRNVRRWMQVLNVSVRIVTFREFQAILSTGEQRIA